MMPDDKRNIDGNSDPHFDGEYEGILNDPTGSGRRQMGIRSDRKQTTNPFQVTNLKNNEMKDFESLTRGKTVEEE
ncbi:hypothetical protein MUB24_08035 [Lederbergia sp. NSJ-179]|uniref:hypothetical protein n=1 Tax=Lederbergia sp. NSJ-179 TaxID=2931402 RepID=UPI001FD49D40|nr:hypothetical protein [Lederbergia sp. NSJ-179]MCJ7840853.1 hypothetical protein [Lederbergia sp. NSJ-179]